ncbi:MAG: hypothetical protein NZO58_06570 [Gemmataceae bacterium]|nr:hypothetical protein [Gemmataceae bacterium]
MIRHACAAALLLALVCPTTQAQIIVGPMIPAPIWNRVYLVQVRTWTWSERTFANDRDAVRFAQAMRSQGRAAYVQRHAWHTRVRFQVPAWQTYQVTYNHFQAHQLERWLEWRGFDARVIPY